MKKASIAIVAVAILAAAFFAFGNRADYTGTGPAGGVTPSNLFDISGQNIVLKNPVYWTLGDASTTGAFGTLAVAGTAVKGALVGTTAAIGGSAVSPGICASATTTVSGATTAMTVSVTPATTTAIGDYVYQKGYVSAANEVTVKVCTVATSTPVAIPYNVRVTQ